MTARIATGFVGLFATTGVVFLGVLASAGREPPPFLTALVGAALGMLGRDLPTWTRRPPPATMS